MKKLLFILLIALVATGCKKEKKIERNLWKKGGEWEIKSFEESSTSATNPEYNDSYVINNGGTIQFNKDKTGEFNLSPELEEYLELGLNGKKFTYYNTENSIFFIYGDEEGLAYDLEWDKNKIVISYNQTDEDTYYDENNNPVTVKSIYTMKFNCEKK